MPATTSSRERPLAVVLRADRRDDLTRERLDGLHEADLLVGQAGVCRARSLLGDGPGGARPRARRRRTPGRRRARAARPCRRTTPPVGAPSLSPPRRRGARPRARRHRRRRAAPAPHPASGCARSRRRPSRHGGALRGERRHHLRHPSTCTPVVPPVRATSACAVTPSTVTSSPSRVGALVTWCSAPPAEHVAGERQRRALPAGVEVPAQWRHAPRAPPGRLVPRVVASCAAPHDLRGRTRSARTATRRPRRARRDRARPGPCRAVQLARPGARADGAGTPCWCRHRARPCRPARHRGGAGPRRASAPRDDLGEHRVVRRRDRTALEQRTVDAHALAPVGSRTSVHVPPVGRNPGLGSSAYTRASTACPSTRTPPCSHLSRSSAATRSCCSTRSSARPSRDTASSVTGCSTCRDVFIFRNDGSSGASPDTMNSTVPGPV